MRPYPAIYDFELFPYAVGDVLTWCVQSAIRAARAGREVCDLYLCADPKSPACMYQRGLIGADNQGLYVNELLGAFSAHPNFGSIHLFSDREAMRAKLAEYSAGDDAAMGAYTEYRRALSMREAGDFEGVNAYFRRSILSHEAINAHYAETGAIPMLKPSAGCGPDIDALMVQFTDKRIVVFHPRLRRLDASQKAAGTYWRDADFLEWYEFLRHAGRTRQDVQFVVVGRTQEKPLEILRLPNVTSLRTLGFGLGHEISLIQRADLFIGTSSGFAAAANFSSTPYFITRVNKWTHDAYAIPDHSTSLPFAVPGQELIEGDETVAILAALLDRGLALTIPRPTVTRRTDPSITRFSDDDAQADAESFFLVAPRIQAAQEALRRGDRGAAEILARRIADCFPRLPPQSEELRALLQPAAPNLAVQLLARVRRQARRILAAGKNPRYAVPLPQAVLDFMREPR